MAKQPNARSTGAYSTYFIPGGEAFEPGDWLSAVANPKAPAWEANPHGFIRFETADSIYWLMMNFVSHRLAFQYKVDSASDWSKSKSLVSVGERASLNAFEILEDLDVVSKGSLIPLERARMVIADFLNDPAELPASIDWVGWEELQWPDG